MPGKPNKRSGQTFILDFRFRNLLDNLLTSDHAFIHAGFDVMKTSGGQHSMGETPNELFQLSFNASLKVDFQGSRVTSDGGLILVRELDERLSVGDLIAKHLSDA